MDFFDWDTLRPETLRKTGPLRPFDVSVLRSWIFELKAADIRKGKNPEDNPQVKEINERLCKDAVLHGTEISTPQWF